MKVFGWLLLIPGGIFLLMSPMPLCEAEANTSASFGLIFLGLLAAVPGGLLLRGGTRRERDEELQEQMAGFVRSHEAFTLDELARHIGRPPAVTQTMLHRDIARYQLPLVMHRASGRYMRLDRLSRAASVADRCQSCGGSIDTQIVFEGERINCPYCGCVVQTHAPGTQPRTPAPAPAPVPTPTAWQQATPPPAQGPWVQPQPPQPQSPAPQANPWGHQQGPWGHG